MNVESLRRTCGVRLDTTISNDDDAEAERVMYLAGPDSVRVAVFRDTVRRIDVFGPGLHTSDGIHVGQQLGQFKKDSLSSASIGEASVYLELGGRSNCGVGFTLSSSGEAGSGEEGSVSHEDLLSWPDSIFRLSHTSPKALNETVSHDHRPSLRSHYGGAWV